MNPINNPKDPGYRPPLDRSLPFPPQGEVKHPNLKEHLYANLRADQVVLDVGCGPGPFEYQQFAAKFIGYDSFEPDKLSGLKENDEFHHGRLESFPFPDASIDAVVMGFILEHVTSPADFLKEAARVLKPGGYCYVAVPDHRSLEDRLFRMATSVAGSTRGPHIQRFTFENLRDLSEKETDLRCIAWHHLSASFLWMEHPKLRWARKPFIGLLKLLRAIGIDFFRRGNCQMILQKSVAR